MNVRERMLPLYWHGVKREIREALGRIKSPCFPLQSALTTAQLRMKMCLKFVSKLAHLQNTMSQKTEIKILFCWLCWAWVFFFACLLFFSSALTFTSDLSISHFITWHSAAPRAPVALQVRTISTRKQFQPDLLSFPLCNSALFINHVNAGVICQPFHIRLEMAAQPNKHFARESHLGACQKKKDWKTIWIHIKNYSSFWWKPTTPVGDLTHIKNHYLQNWNSFPDCFWSPTS